METNGSLEGRKNKNKQIENIMNIYNCGQNEFFKQCDILLGI